MSSDEEMAVRGRTMTEFADAQRHLATLHSESQRIGKLVQTVGTMLIRSFPYKSDIFTAEHWAALDVSKMQSLLTDMKETSERVDMLRDQLRRMGLLNS